MHERNHAKHHRHVDDPARAGARQPARFDPQRAARLDDPARFAYLPAANVAELLDAPKDSLVVDFGAGTGAYAIPLAQARSDVTVVALDEQPEMLALLPVKPAAAALKNLRPVLPRDLPQFRARAARVLAINVLHELGDEALADLKALLAPSGFALFIDWNAEADRPVGPPRDHVYAPAEAAKRLESLGFAVEPLDPLAYHYALRARPR